MAGPTFDDAQVVKLEGYPVINNVAIGTFAREMVRIERGGGERAGR